LMLMNSGANFKFKKTIPHLLGVGIGFTLMIALVGLGVIKLFDSFPLSYDVLKVLSIVYLLYLAFKIANSTGNLDQKSSSAKPFTFIQAALFQWVNPKAWTMALTAISIYAPSKSLSAVLFVAMVFGIVNLPCISAWVVLGQKIQVLLTDQRRLRAFNISMALLLILSLYPAL
jgi:threonine/homoserine/homoserine lactone efflux protein